MKNSNWIKAGFDMREICPIFKKEFSVEKDIISATLSITSMGVYEAVLNGERVGDFILAPGFTSYKTRLQYQTYDITELLKKDNNELCVTVGNGWYCGSLTWARRSNLWGSDRALIGKITIIYADRSETILTDSTWQVAKSNILRAEIYDGEIYDARINPKYESLAQVFDYDKSNLIPQEGEAVVEQERLKPISIIKTQNGETVVDFGQNITGYIEFETVAQEGEKVEFSHAEVLDVKGNFFRDCLRTAMQKTDYTCKAGRQVYKPRHTFMGFRYLRVEKAPENIQFTAIVVHSDIKRTGHFECGNPKINKLYSNIIWGQKGNFLDIPTDCPQRDERLGWTGDAQVFIRTASYNYDVERFFSKWLNDVIADQLPNGSIAHIVPNMIPKNGSAAWGDAATICPWQIYLTYGNKEILRRHFDSMKKWVEFSMNPDRFHYGDWLALDEPEGTKKVIGPNMTEEDTFKGNSNQQMISDSFNLYSMSILIKVGELLNENVISYKDLYSKRLVEFQNKYKYHTQTEHVLPLYFHLAKDEKETAKKLAQLVIDNGNRLQTGFVGTPYLLHVLSDNGYVDIAYNLLLQEKFPSWLFSVNNGATTIWEHWDGIKEDGSLSTDGMNSYNHYAYGAVADWMYGVAAGINIDEKNVAFENVILKPIPDKRLGYVSASIETRFGLLTSKWSYEGDTVKYEFQVPNRAEIILGNEVHKVSKGNYCYSVKI